MRRVALVASALGSSLAVAVAVGGPARAQDEPAAIDRQLLALVDRTPWVGDGMDFTLQLRVEDAPAGAQLQLTVHDRVTSRSAFARSLEGQGLRRRLSGPEPVPLADLDADGDGIVQSTVPLTPNLPGAAVVSVPTPGVYPVVVDLLDDDGEVLDTLRTHLVRLASDDGDDDAGDAEPLGVAVVVPFGAPPVHLDPAGFDGPDLGVEELTGSLAEHPAVPINLAPTPESVAAAAATDAPAVAALAAALEGSQVLRGPWVELDEAAWAGADEAELASQLERGEETLRRVLQVSPDTTRLLPAGTGLDQLGAMVEHGTRAVVVAEEDLSALDDDDFPYTLGRPFRVAIGDDGDDDGGGDGESIPALASDGALVELAAEAQTDPVLAAHHVLADLAVIAGDEPESNRVATFVLPGAAMSPTFLDELLDGLEPPAAPPPAAPPVDPDADPEVPVAPPAPIPAASPIIRATTLADALRSVEPAGADGGADADDPLVRRLTAEDDTGSVARLAEGLAARRADLASYRAIFGPADELGERMDAVLATVASSELGGGARRAALGAVDDAVAAQFAGLHGPERQQVTLTAREGRVQLVLTNDTGRPADVTLLVRGDRLVFPEAESGRMDVHLAGRTTRLDLRVETRSSGDAPIDIQLTSPDERLDLGRSRITVRATAVSGVGIFLMGAAAAFLAAWWTRTIRRDRRATRAHPAHARK